MAYNKANDAQAVSIWDLEQTNTDITVSPHVMVRGQMGKTSAGEWVYLGAEQGRLLISGSLAAAASAPLSADSSSVSAIQEGANRLRVSTFSGDAATMRVSAIGGTNSPLSADSSSISAKQGDAANLMVSAKSNDGGLLRVSVLPATLTVSAHEVKQSDAASMRVSVVGTLTVSSHEVKQSDAASLLVSAKSDSAGQLRVSTFSNDGGTFRVSAQVFGDTTGSWTVFRTLNASASQAVKATAGALHGYYLWNSDTKYNYLKFFNTSGAINVGTDTPILTVAIPPSAAANVEFAGGIAGFTNGIGIAALSAVADNATTASPASAVGGNIFYV